jgi:glycerate 2-kinase
MNIIVAPDKFKGSLTSRQVCQCMQDGIKQVLPDAAVQCFAMADGGDGFDDVMGYYLQTQTITSATVNALRQPLQASWQWQPLTKTAIITVASASGLALLHPWQYDATKASTYGTGLQIKQALQKGAQHIILGLGGSATTDAGMGILAALGFQLLNAEGISLLPSGETLADIKRIIPPAEMPAVTFTLACDVEHVMYGKNGAAVVFAPQKGASITTVKLLDDGLKSIASLLQQQTGKNLAQQPGAGAAGGIATGLLSFFNGSMVKGAQLVLQTAGLSAALPQASLLITGEGCLDSQTAYGKVIAVVNAAAQLQNVPVMAICGQITVSPQQLNQYGFRCTRQLVDTKLPPAKAMQQAKALLIQQTAAAVRQFVNQASSAG